MNASTGVLVENVISEKQNGCQSAIFYLNPNLTDRKESRKKPEQLWFRK